MLRTRLPVFALVAIGCIASLPVQRARATTGYYEDFGGKAGITALIDTFVGNVAADRRINFYFAHANIPALKAALVDQVCHLEGGPCAFDMNMKAVHQGMNITENAFNALAEDMIRAMDKEQIPIAAQNNLLAKLAAMGPEIISK